MDVTLVSGWRKRTGPVGSALMSASTAQPVWASFQSKVWPRTIQHKNKSLHVTFSSYKAIKPLRWSDVHMVIIKVITLWLRPRACHFGFLREDCYLIAWISETDTNRKIISSLFYPNKRFQSRPHEATEHTILWCWRCMIFGGAGWSRGVNL